jgi:hypothetical protein
MRGIFKTVLSQLLSIYLKFCLSLCSDFAYNDTRCAQTSRICCHVRKRPNVSRRIFQGRSPGFRASTVFRRSQSVYCYECAGVRYCSWFNIAHILLFMFITLFHFRRHQEWTLATCRLRFIWVSRRLRHRYGNRRGVLDETEPRLFQL